MCCREEEYGICDPVVTCGRCVVAYKNVEGFQTRDRIPGWEMDGMQLGRVYAYPQGSYDGCTGSRNRVDSDFRWILDLMIINYEDE